MAFKWNMNLHYQKATLMKMNLHRTGTMRLAVAADEILPMKDPRVQ